MRRATIDTIGLNINLKKRSVMRTTKRFRDFLEWVVGLNYGTWRMHPNHCVLSDYIRERVLKNNDINVSVWEIAGNPPSKINICINDDNYYSPSIRLTPTEVNAYYKIKEGLFSIYTVNELISAIRAAGYEKEFEDARKKIRGS
jgi:hypothetical protein